MSEIKKILRCYKCGEILQDTDATKPGYIISEVYNNHTSEILLCNKCFEKTIFNNNPQVNDFSKDLYVLLEDAQAADALVVLVVDLFSFEGCTNKNFIKAIGSCNVIVVANKRDLIPSKADDDYLRDYVAHRLRVAGLNVTDVILSSVHESEKYLDTLVSAISEKRRRHDVYLIGLPNSGKTSIASIFLKNYQNTTRRVIQTITYPGTTTKVVEIPLDRTSVLFDVPGFLTNNAVWDIVEKSIVPMIVPNKEVSGKKITLSEGSAFSFGGLARVDLLSKKRTQITIYCSDKVEIKRYFRAKDMDALFFNAIEKKSVKPISAHLDSHENFDIYDINTTETGSRDIGILGLGWFNFEGDNQKFRLTIPKGTYVYFSRAKIKNVNK
jgi:ribosome biogenesis GTPase A